jgi:hypothetical protein
MPKCRLKKNNIEGIPSTRNMLMQQDAAPNPQADPDGLEAATDQALRLVAATRATRSRR